MNWILKKKLRKKFNKKKKRNLLLNETSKGIEVGIALS